MDKKKESVGILVVGDWTIDENWIVTAESSKTSSHIGKQQYRSKITDVSSQLFSLCGAGDVARLLHSLSNKEFLHSLSNEGKEINIFGLGFWDPDDTKMISALFRSDCEVLYQTPHTLKGMFKFKGKTGENPICHEVNNNCFECSEGCKRLKSLSTENSGTNRVLRVYSQSGTQDPFLLQRYDFEATNTNNTEHIKNVASDTISKWKDIIESIEVVVIVDHNKGGITSELIKILKENPWVKNARWYARVKDPNAVWISEVSDKLKLIVTGPMMLDLESDSWFLGYKISIGAIKWLCEKAKKPLELIEHEHKYVFNRTEWKNNKSNCSIVALHENNNLAALVPKNIHELAKEQPNESDFDLYITTEHSKEPKYKVGRTSILFSSLIDSYENRIKSNDQIDESVFKRALQHAYTWCKNYETDLKDQVMKLNPNLNFRKNYKEALGNNLKGDFEVIRRDLNHELDLWREAFDYAKHCVVNLSETSAGESTSNPQGKFQLWRGWSPIQGYISLYEENNRSISKLISGIESFLHEQKPTHSLSSLIIGDPGSGKSYLVERLAKQLDLEFVDFNITTLTSIDDLTSCFDSISSLQTQKPDKPLIVFWDEIDAPLNGENVYSHFLSPIWNGYYRRKGQNFQLQPCIWIFAGTQKLFEQKEPKNAIPKGSDFISRINGPIINLRVLNDTINALTDKNKDYYKNLAKMEQLYMAVSLIKRRFPNALLISEDVLDFFKVIKPKYSIRSLEFIISKMNDIKHYKVARNNLPNIKDISMWIYGNDIEQLQDKLDKAKEKKEEFVRIYIDPPH